MFESNLTAEQRLSEYNLLLGEVRHLSIVIVQIGFAGSWREAIDTIELRSFYKQRRKALKQQMLADCKKCYGTGTSLSDKITVSTYFPVCKRCGRTNRTY